MSAESNNHNHNTNVVGVPPSPKKRKRSWQNYDKFLSIISKLCKDYDTLLFNCLRWSETGITCNICVVDTKLKGHFTSNKPCTDFNYAKLKAHCLQNGIHFKRIKNSHILNVHPMGIIKQSTNNTAVTVTVTPQNELQSQLSRSNVQYKQLQDEYNKLLQELQQSTQKCTVISKKYETLQQQCNSDLQRHQDKITLIQEELTICQSNCTMLQSHYVETEKELKLLRKRAAVAHFNNSNNPNSAKKARLENTNELSVKLASLGIPQHLHNHKFLYLNCGELTSEGREKIIQFMSGRSGKFVRDQNISNMDIPLSSCKINNVCKQRVFRMIFIPQIKWKIITKTYNYK